ncbi:MAG: bifunctional oligoribonuclease/PAP phosphatase NrnA [Anaerolineaceae bacterium]|nr:bifunctional oligoribonuclease/PAP phosphatase NrnA [Anaerolineaceae bacterium]
MNNIFDNEEIKTLFNRSKTYLIAAHIRPDGDAIGSALGLGLALRNIGKDVTIYLADGVPSNFQHLPGNQTVINTLNPNSEFDLIISLDSSDQERLGDAFSSMHIDLQIDHHVTNVNYARINLIDPTAVATCAILAEFLPKWDLQISEEIATLLMTGILTDSIGFRTSNTTSKSLRLAADLIDSGANLPEIYHETLVGRTYQQVNYWGFGLQRLQKKGNIAWTSLTLADRKLADYNGNDDADLNTLLSSISECDVTILFVEQRNKHVKVSWRSKPGLDVSQIAFKFNGGGHISAAGADINGELSDIQNLVLKETFSTLMQEQEIKIEQ